MMVAVDEFKVLMEKNIQEQDKAFKEKARDAEEHDKVVIQLLHAEHRKANAI